MPDGLLEADALGAVGACVVHDGLGLAERLRDHEAALELELLHEQLPAHALLADAHVLGEHDVVEEAVDEGDGLLPHLVEMADGVALDVVRHEPQGVLVVLVGRALVLGDDDRVQGQAGQRRPGLLAVEQVGAVGLLDGDAGHSVVIGTGGGLGDGRGGDAGALAVLDGVHDEFLLGLAAEIDDVRDGVRVGGEGQRGAGELVQLLGQDDLGELAARHAAHFLGKAEMHEAGLAVGHGRFEADVVVHLVRLLHRFLGEVALGVLARAFDKELLVIG